ncbi:MAG: hypothetical protein AB1540_00480 [Bdellovibrionota bacterium]
MAIQSLKIVHSESGSSGLEKTQVKVEFDLDSRAALLKAKFKVDGVPSFTNSKLPMGASAWGLWEWDVVEVFLRASPQPTYYEFQISPLGQYFELEIFKPRKKFNKDFSSGFTHSSKVLSETAWEAEFGIPLKKLGWTGAKEDLQGNAFAILGKPRSYWSLFLPAQEKPDFHLPRHFKPIFL